MRISGLTMLLATAWLAGAGCKAEPAPDAPPLTFAVTVPVDMHDVASCEPCHGAVVEEWRTSQHSRAHHSKDPIYAGVRKIRMAKEGAAVAEACAGCHTPRFAADDPAGEVGVGCAACHNVAEVKAGVSGPKALIAAEPGMLRGPHDVAPGVAPHGTGPAAPHLQDGRRLCLACHGEMDNAHGKPVCETGREYEVAGTEQSCVDCHMPLVERPSGAASTARSQHRSHAFLGPHHRWMHPEVDATIEGAPELTAGFAEDGKLRVSVANRARHRYPTGFPGRMAVLKLIGKDASGAAVWTNWKDDPLAESPNSLIHKVYHDAKGQPTLAPYGVEIARDTRLLPNATLTVTYDVPGSVATVEVRLVQRLLPPKLAKRLGLEGALEATPKVVASKTVARPTDGP